MMKLALAMASALAISAACAQTAENVQKAGTNKVTVDPEGKKHQWMTEGGEREMALRLAPNLEHGKEVYEVCAACHLPEGWGRADGTFPEIAHQHRTVLIKQLTDIREGNRDNPTMYPFALPSEIGGEQSVADVAEYISKLPMNPENGFGPGTDLAHGKRLYEDNCVRCHGTDGAGDAVKYYPRLQGQHYEYLLRVYKWIKEGRRRNANPDMMEQIKNFSDKDTIDVLDYVSRLQPSKEIVGAKGWQNPDFK